MCGHRLQHTTEKGQLPSAYPSEILPGFLYLGSYDNASRCELLKAMDITHILNVSRCRGSIVRRAPRKAPLPLRMLDRHLNTSVACLQTVPDSSNLYKNSFTYDTVEQLPPDFAACNKFIGVTTEA